MFKNFFSFIKKYWIVAIALAVIIPFSVIAAEYIGDISYNQVGEVLDVSGTKGNNITLSYFGRSITLDVSKYVSGPHYKEGYTLFIPNRTEAEFVSFLSSKAAIFLTGSCSSDCTGKACGALNGCGDKCINQTCGAGYTCSELGVCTATNTCGTKNCGLDSSGNVCGTCDSKDYCNNGYCQPCSCGSSNCGNNQCGQSCGSCTSPMKCVINIGGYLNCVACTPKCDGGSCGYSDGCGGYCGCREKEACSGGKCVSCTPKCDGKKCGDDGCGGSCGSCDTKAGEFCINYSCQACTPKSCDGSFCGDDGCGGSCSCGEGKICSEGKCFVCDSKANCDGKADCAPDGCGGTCGGKTCDAGQVCNVFAGCQECTCDEKECGDDGCGNPCGECPDPEGQICAPLTGKEYLNSMCVDCPNEGLECGYSECGRYYGPCEGGKTCIDTKCQ